MSMLTKDVNAEKGDTIVIGECPESEVANEAQAACCNLWDVCEDDHRSLMQSAVREAEDKLQCPCSLHVDRYPTEFSLTFS
jgi:hypothetical protein